MRNYLRFGAMATLLSVLGSLAAVETKAQVLLNDILKKMDASYKTLQTLQANVTMEKYDSVLGEKDLTTGTLKYLPKTEKRVMYVRIDWVTPSVEHISVIGDAYTLYRPRTNQVYVGKTDKAKNNAKVGGALGFVGMSKEELKTNYAVKYLGREKVPGGDATARLELTPKKAVGYKLAYIWIDDNGMPVMAQIVEKNNDTTTVLLSGLKKNETIRGEDFAINYPKTIKPIRG
jgi:outer membrane lipoprotein-sorting protein